MLKFLSFNNYKCLTGQNFNFDKVNVFTGYNGRGKSSVMQAILMLSQSSRNGDLNSFAHLHVNGIFVKLGVFDELLENPDDYRFSLDLILQDNDGNDHKIHLQYEIDDDYSVGTLVDCVIDGVNYFDTASSMSKDKSIDSSGVKDLKQLPIYLYNQIKSQNVHFISAERKGPLKFVERDEIPDYFNIAPDGCNTINILSNYRNLINPEMNVSDSDKNSYELQTATSMWIEEIMHGGCVAVDGIAVRKDKKQTDVKGSSILKLGFGIDKDGKRFPAYHVGFGYSYILSIVVTALIAKKNDIVIVENPEAHLHPEAQTRLTFLLAKLGARGVQVFVETHSEHIVNGFRLAALKDKYKLRSEDIRIFFFDFDFKIWPLTIEQNGRIKNWPKRFFDQYQNELAEILKLGAKVASE